MILDVIMNSFHIRLYTHVSVCQQFSITCSNYDNYIISVENNALQRHVVEKKLKNGKTFENNIAG